MATGGAIKAGQAWVGLGVVDTAFVKGLDSAQRRLRAFGATTAKASLALTAAGGGILAPIGKAFKESFSRASDMKTLSDRFGVTSEKVSAMAYAFERGGSDLEEFAATLTGLQSSLSAAADSNGTDTLRQLGIQARSLVNIPLDKQFDLILGRLNRLSNPMDRASKGTELFGSAWNKLSGTTLKSADALKALEEEAEKVGAVVSTEDAARGQKITLALTEAWQALKYAILEVGTALLPQADNIGDLAAKIREAAGHVRNWIAENRGLVLTAVAVGAALVAAGAALAALSTAIGVAATICGVLAVAVKLLIATVGFLLSPIGLVIAAVVALGVAWATMTESGQKFTSDFAAVFKGLGDIFSQTWGGIKDAIAAGDIGLALDVAGAGLKAAWASVMYELTKAWVAFKDIVVDGWHKINDGIEDAAVGFHGAWIELTDSKEASEEFMRNANEGLGGERKKRDTANKSFRNQQIADAKAAKEQAQKGLDDIAEKARVAVILKEQADAKERQKKVNEAWEKAQQEKKGNLFGGFFNAAARLKMSGGNEPGQLYAASKGTFGSYGGNLQQSLGYGDNVGQRILDTSKNQLGVLKGIKTAIEKKTGVNWK